jgi:hypothetical protein
MLHQGMGTDRKGRSLLGGIPGSWSIAPAHAHFPNRTTSVTCGSMRRRVREQRIAALAAKNLLPDEQLVGTGTVWAVRLTRLPLLLRGRHLHPLVLTDKRLLLFEHPKRRARRTTPLLGLPLEAYHVVRARRLPLLYQLTLEVGEERRLVVEFRRRDHALGSLVNRALTAPRNR